jgi:transcriptional regulator with XRE-family HTH domain
MRHRLLQERIRHGLSYREVADAINVTERAYRYIELGGRTPSLKTAYKLEDLFEIPLRELLVLNSTSKDETA